MTDELIAIVLKAVSEKIGIELSYAGRVNGDLCCRDAKGFSYGVVGYRWPQGFIVRGVVRNHRRGGRYSWLCNGQVSNHGKQVAWWQESGEDSFVIPNSDLPPE